MKIVSLEHVSFEGPGSILPWIDQRGHHLRRIALYQDELLPALNDFDWLIIMGGPMSVNEEARYPWLISEKLLVRQAMQEGKRVLGICLGAQIIAAAMGASVALCPEKEIGWWPVRKSATSTNAGRLVDAFPQEFTTFHWHSDRFEIPATAVAFLSSEGCDHQAFAVGDRVLALQFHLETTPDFVASLVARAASNITLQDRFVQPAEKFLNVDPDVFARGNQLMSHVLDTMESA